MEQKQPEIKTKDIYEAAALMAKGVKLITLERGTGFYWFVFEGGDARLKYSDLFWRNELNGSFKDYADAIRTLKDRIFARG